MAADDDLTAELEEIRKRQQCYASAPALAGESLHDWLIVRKTLCEDDVPLLLAALRAVLELADRTDNYGRTRSPLARETARMMREAISREIIGKD